MKIKKFKAKTFGEALELVKRELGKEAIIISTEEKRGLRPWVEITAAVDYEDSFTEYRRNFTQFRDMNKPLKEPTTETTEEILRLKEELMNLKDTLEEMRNNGYEISLPLNKKRLFYYLKERAVRDEFALRLCEKAKTLEELASLISSEIDIRNGDFHRKAVMLIGPTGVGKTTTVAKLAAKAVREGRRVGIINLDTYRIGAIEQIRIYARILGIPLVVASNIYELKNALKNLSITKDTVFIDTVGRRPSDQKYIEELNTLLKGILKDKDLREVFALEVHLLMGINADDDMLVEASRFYRKLPINCLAFTKVDEAVRFGSIYNLVLLYQKPVAYITTGQTVPDDIEFINKQELVNLILRKGYFLSEVEV